MIEDVLKKFVVFWCEKTCVFEKGGVGKCLAGFLSVFYFQFFPFDMLNSSIVSILIFM